MRPPKTRESSSRATNAPPSEGPSNTNPSGDIPTPRAPTFQQVENPLSKETPVTAEGAFPGPNPLPIG